MAVAGITRPISRNKYGRWKHAKKAIRVKVPRRGRKGVKRNARAINRLGRAVRAAKMAGYGPLQTNYQIASRALVPIASLPVLTPLNDFTCNRDPGSVSEGCPFYQYNVGGTLTVGGMYTTQLAPPSVFHGDYNKNRPGEKGQYFPVRAEYSVQIVGNPNLDNTHIRFDMFTQKVRPIVQSIVAGNSKALPQALNSLTHMASGGVMNRLSPYYFKKYWSKTFFMNSSKTNAATKGTTGNVIRFKFSIHGKYPVKMLTIPPNPVPDTTVNQALEDALNEHIDHSDHSSAEDDADAGVDASFTTPLNYRFDNTALGSQLWLLISTDDETTLPVPPELSDQVNVRISRKVIWRDYQGTTLGVMN